jgi:hypothetical protein
MGRLELDRIPIGRRMSWAAARTTTRVEDMAYSLLGIFNVKMPLIYGKCKTLLLACRRKSSSPRMMSVYLPGSGKGMHKRLAIQVSK